MHMRITYLMLWLMNRFRRFSVTMDGTDNSVIVNQSLYRALLRLGIETNNRIHVFHIEGHRYGFCVFPDNQDPGESPYFCHLQYNEQIHKIGFECLHPSVSKMFYEWEIDHDALVTVNVVPRMLVGRDHSFIYFEILNQ